MCENVCMYIYVYMNIAQMAGADRESTEHENNMRYLYEYM
jgi:hypothetical protein